MATFEKGLSRQNWKQLNKNQATFGVKEVLKIS
jgi:hypothetical protein